MTEQEFLDRYADLKPSYEFVNGEVTQKPMTKRAHMLLQDELQAVLRDFRRSIRSALSGADPTVNVSRSSDRRYRAPDVAYWGPDKAQGDEIFLPPTLAVEIQSQGQAIGMLRAKCREYRDRGVDVAWLVIPTRRELEVFDARHDGLVLGERDVVEPPELPGFRLELRELFKVLD
jgi:Uma2 family endonuclease